MEVFGRRIIYDSGLDIRARVADVIQGREWNWPNARSIYLMEITNSVPASLHPDSSLFVILYVGCRIFMERSLFVILGRL